MREEAKEEIFEFKVKTRRKNKKKRLHLFSAVGWKKNDNKRENARPASLPPSFSRDREK